DAGVVGGSIEDATGDASKPIYDFGLAVERVAASVETARALPFAFVLTARAGNMIQGRLDLDAPLKGPQAFEQAGADLRYPAGLGCGTWPRSARSWRRCASPSMSS